MKPWRFSMILAASSNSPDTKPSWTGAANTFQRPTANNMETKQIRTSLYSVISTGTAAGMLRKINDSRQQPIPGNIQIFYIIINAYESSP